MDEKSENDNENDAFNYIRNHPISLRRQKHLEAFKSISEYVEKIGEKANATDDEKLLLKLKYYESMLWIEQQHGVSYIGDEVLSC